jgi:hypothetical protein
MFKKKQKKTNNEDLKLEDCNGVLEPHKQPMVFLFDFEEEVERKLEELRVNYSSGSFGATVNVENIRNDEKLLKLNHDYPSNLHEFDIVMLDLTANKSEKYDPSKHQLGNASGNTAHALLSTYPEQRFDPRPLSISLVSRDINEFCEKKSIVIAFCGAEYRAEYQFVEITDRGTRVTGSEPHSNFSFYNRFPGHRTRHGTKASPPQKESKLSPLFLKHIDKISYHTIFYHPTVWRDGKNQEVSEFIPLLFNERDEIVSYAHFVEKSIVLVFPDIEDKPGFISELFKTYLPDIIPEIFPFHGEFKWLDCGDYPLPGEKELSYKRVETEEKYKKDIADNEEALAALKGKYKFLSDLISETGGALVSAVEAYLKWLEFDSVVNLDDTNPELLEEDIQVGCGDRFLVVEIKGLGGTSTDKDCAQVSKIKYRRAEQRGKFDVYGLYIVNHQRYMPPKSRSNPPFTAVQIKDADLDKRSLLTTYELYKAYFLIEECILNKSEVREAFFKTGLVCLEPEGLTSIGTAKELYMDGQVAILNLNAVNVKVGDAVIVKKQGEYFGALIESLQIEGEDVQSCDEGAVGVKFNRKLKKNSEVFVRMV